MSLIFKIQTVLTRREPADAEAFLERSGLKTRYGNIREVKTNEEGFFVYKQKSKPKKNGTQYVTVDQGEDRFVGVFEYVKTKKTRGRKIRAVAPS